MVWILILTITSSPVGGQAIATHEIMGEEKCRVAADAWISVMKSTGLTVRAVCVQK